MEFLNSSVFSFPSPSFLPPLPPSLSFFPFPSPPRVSVSFPLTPCPCPYLFLPLFHPVSLSPFVSVSLAFSFPIRLCPPLRVSPFFSFPLSLFPSLCRCRAARSYSAQGRCLDQQRCYAAATLAAAAGVNSAAGPCRCAALSSLISRRGAAIQSRCSVDADQSPAAQPQRDSLCVALQKGTVAALFSRSRR